VSQPIPGADQEGHPNPPRSAWVLTIVVTVVLFAVLAIFLFVIRPHAKPTEVKTAALYWGAAPPPAISSSAFSTLRESAVNLGASRSDPKRESRER